MAGFVQAEYERIGRSIGQATFELNLVGMLDIIQTGAGQFNFTTHQAFHGIRCATNQKTLLDNGDFIGF